MLYRGFRDFRAEDRALEADMRRWNQVLEDAFAAAERELSARGKPVRATGGTYQAQHGEFVLAGYNENTTIILPLSSPDTACRTVDVCRVANTITIVAQTDQTVDGAASVTLSTTGRREFKDDGFGGFWGTT